MKKFLCICLSSTIQRTISFKSVELEKVNRSDYYIENASGKAINSARILNQLEKGCVYAVCPLGKNNAEKFLSLTNKDEIPLSYVTIDGDTRQCWTLLDKTKGTTTELVVSENLTKDIFYDKEEVRLLKYIYDLSDDVDAVILAGSRPSCWHNDLYSTIASMVKEKGKLFLADFIKDDLINTIKTSCPDIIKINDEEFAETFFNKKTLSDSELKDAVCTKSKELNNIIIITRGIKSTYAADKGIFFECPVEKVKAVNTTACGDSFNAGFIYEYVNSNDFEKALQKGTWCASRNAEKEIPGTIK